MNGVHKQQQQQFDDNDLDFGSNDQDQSESAAADDYETTSNDIISPSSTIMESEGPSVEITDYDWGNTYPIDTTVPEPDLRQIKNIRNYGGTKPYWNFNGEDMMIHNDCAPKGGVNMADHDGIVPAAIKDVSKRIASKLIKGQIGDMSTISQPAYLHHYITMQHLHKNDLSFCGEFKKAARTSNVIQKMKHVIKAFVASNFVNPTLLSCRLPLNPILGETCQREMADGTKFYAEQICHRPQTTAFLLEDGDGDYTFSGSFTNKGWLNGPNSVAGTKSAPNIRLKLN